ncbi:hypothetical protein Tco_1187070 [Tanacetum coccineum]
MDGMVITTQGWPSGKRVCAYHSKMCEVTCTIIDNSLESYYRSYALTASPTLEPPALTTLYLGNVTMCGNKVKSKLQKWSLRRLAKRNTGLVQKRMENLRVKLEREKAEIETNMAHIDQRNTPMESDKAKVHEQHVPQLDHLVQSEKTMTHIDACFEDLSRQIEKGKSKISHIISDLDYIKQDIAKLPTLNRDDEPCFSSLCSEADIVVKKIMDHVKILCDMKESRSSVYIRGLATTSLPSF